MRREKRAVEARIVPALEKVPQFGVDKYLILFILTPKGSAELPLRQRRCAAAVPLPGRLEAGRSGGGAISFHVVKVIPGGRNFQKGRDG